MRYRRYGMLLLLSLCLPSLAAGATNYFVSKQAGVASDSHNGTSTGTPWLTIGKVNSSSFAPGDTISFRRGDTWTAETLTPPSSGSASLPITFNAYGTGNRPVFNGNDAVTNVVEFSNRHDLVFDSLEIRDAHCVNFLANLSVGPVFNLVIRNSSIHTNHDPGTPNPCSRASVEVLNMNSNGVSQTEGQVHHITIEDNDYIGDNTHNCISLNGGVHDAIIRNNIIHNCPHAGIDIKQNRHFQYLL